MGDYTPTTEEVRKAYIGNRWSLDQEFERLAGPEFDRWLAAERARVWDEAVEATAAAIWSDPRRPRWTWTLPDNPYKETS